MTIKMVLMMYHSLHNSLVPHFEGMNLSASHKRQALSALMWSYTLTTSGGLSRHFASHTASGIFTSTGSSCTTMRGLPGTGTRMYLTTLFRARKETKQQAPGLVHRLVHDPERRKLTRTFEASKLTQYEHGKTWKQQYGSMTRPHAKLLGRLLNVHNDGLWLNFLGVILRHHHCLILCLLALLNNL